MTPVPPLVEARQLLRRVRHASLATSNADGKPFASLVATASAPDGSPVLLISRLAVHTKNLLADERVSLLLAAPDADDPLQAARLMLNARAIPQSGGQAAVIRRRYLAVHPDAELFVDFTDFLFVCLEPTGAHLVAGFGRIADLDPADLLTQVEDAATLIAAEEGAVEHMNDDHGDALALYATRLLGAPDGEWRCTGLDPDGLDLVCGRDVRRLDFPSRVTTAAELRKTLVLLANEARARVAS